MGARLEFTWDLSGLASWKGDGISKAVARALKKAGNRAIKTARTAGKRRVRELKAIKSEFLQDRALPLTYPKGSKLENLVWVMRVSGKPVPASKYKARQNRKGVSLTINRGSPKLFEGAFIRRLTSGHVGVFFRPHGEPKKFKHVLTTRVSDVFENRGFITGPDGVQAKAMEKFRNDFARLLPMELDKGK